MFMQIAIGAIGIGIVLMVAYVIISQVRSALPSTTTIQQVNPCLGEVGNTGNVTALADGCVVNAANDTWTAPTVCGSVNLTGLNDSTLISCENLGYSSGTASVQVTIFAGFGLIAVGVIVLAAFGLISIFR